MNNAFQHNNIVFVDGPLEIVNRRIMRHAGHKILEIERLQMRDQPLAIIQEFYHIRDMQIAEGECNAVAGIEASQPIEELTW